LAEKWPEKPDVVAGPAYGGIIVAYELARALGARAVFFERVDGVFQLRRGFEIAKGARVLVVEDVVTTGGSAKEVVDRVKEMGANVVGVASLIHRGAKTKFEEELRPLLRVSPPMWKPEECPLCKEGSKAVKPGSRE
ncbi:MAG: phosphoribosyltransferase family protein, partial [Planctomycetota bacterium]